MSPAEESDDNFEYEDPFEDGSESEFDDPEKLDEDEDEEDEDED